MVSKGALFSVGNKHGADSGEPPQFDGDAAGRYHGYFENEYGEQTIFIFDRQTRTGTLWMGDNGWENTIPVVEGVAQDIVLDEAETLWLKACWLAAATSSDRGQLATGRRK